MFDSINDTVAKHINKNTVLTLSALRNYAFDIITRDDLTYFCDEITRKNKYDKHNKTFMLYNFYDKCISINMKISVKTAKLTFDSYIYRKYLPNYLSSKTIDSCKTNLVNMILLHNIIHEINHARQNEIMTNFPDTYLAILLKINLELLSLEMPNTPTYHKFHNKYLLEYMANTFAGLELLYEIENNYSKDISNDALHLYNVYLAEVILDGYKGKINDDRAQTYPIELLKELCIYLNLGCDSVFAKLEEYENVNNSISDLLFGKHVSNNILNKIEDIKLGRVKTKNLYHNIYLKKFD